MDSNGSHDIYEVKEIVGMKKVGTDYLYKVRWRGYGPENDTWEPQSNFFTCHDVIEEYKSKNKSFNSIKSLRSRNKIAKGADKTLKRIKSNCPPFVKARSKKSKLLSKKALSRRSSTSTCSSPSPSSSSSSSSSSSTSSTSTTSIVARIKIKKEPEQQDEECNSLIELERLAELRGLKNTQPCIKQESQQQLDGDDQQKSISSIGSPLPLPFPSSSSSFSPSSRFNIGYNLNQRFGNDCKTPLIYAAEVGNTKLVEFLLESGAAKDLKDSNGNTALILASQNGHYDIVRSLLLHGANFSIINDAGSNALRTAKLFANDETQHILTKHVSQITMALENQVIELLRSTARISHALFPIQCHSTSENLRFRLLFNFDSIEPFQPGIGFLLFISDLTFSLFKPVSLRFFSPSAKVKVYLNGTLQKSLTEGAKFVFSFTPLRRGVNELLLTIKESQSRQCFIICAYQVTLINSKP